MYRVTADIHALTRQEFRAEGCFLNRRRQADNRFDEVANGSQTKSALNH
jgi:hypothetical protein